MSTTIVRGTLVFCALCWATAVPSVAQTEVVGTISTDTVWTLAGSPYIQATKDYVKGWKFLNKLVFDMKDVWLDK